MCLNAIQTTTIKSQSGHFAAQYIPGIVRWCSEMCLCLCLYGIVNMFANVELKYHNEID